MATIRTAGIISKPDAKEARTLAPALLQWLEARGVAVRIDEITARYAARGGGVPRAELPEGCELVIVLGGDGTLLSAARAIAGRDIPLFAVNLGGLGFLTAITVDELFPELERALRGEHRVARRRMLACEVQRGGEVVARYEALNDVVITKSHIARMIDLVCNVDAHFVCRYKADGLIVATPTGSTAYALSAGGPIMHPKLDAIVVVPMYPHTLSSRPIVVDGNSELKVVVSADMTIYPQVSCDGQNHFTCAPGDTLHVAKKAQKLRLIHPLDHNYYEVCRTKLGWGSRLGGQD